MVVKLLALLLVLGVLAGVLLAVLSWSAKAPPLGLQDGRLRPCPATPNCVRSERGTAPSGRIDPLRFAGEPGPAWRKAKQALEAMGGRIVSEQPEYLHAIFVSRFFRFVDDVELRLDRRAGVIQLRSASRAGHSDLGVNRRRMEALRKRFTSP